LAQKVLVLGYGNPSRGDDGLGLRLAEELEADCPPGVDVDTGFQLNIEDAATASEYDVVVFVDAAASGGEPFEVKRLEPSAEITFSSHVVSPETILAICQDSFDRTPEAYLLAIRGYEFDFSEDLSEGAARNLGEALAEARLLTARLAGATEGEKQ
jgi:hydrogenase maturation protease